MRMVLVYLRNGNIYVHPLVKGTAGFWMAVPPFARIEISDTEGLTRALIASMNSAHITDAPATSDSLLAPLYRLANVDTWKDFASRDCQAVSIEIDDNISRLILQDNRGPKDGFVDTDTVLEIGNGDLTALHKALMKLFGIG